MLEQENDFRFLMRCTEGSGKPLVGVGPHTRMC